MNRRGLLRRLGLLEDRLAPRSETLLVYCEDDRFQLPRSISEARRRANLPAGYAAIFLKIQLDPMDINDLTPLPENQPIDDDMVPHGTKSLPATEKQSPPTPEPPPLPLPAPAPVVRNPWYVNSDPPQWP